MSESSPDAQAGSSEKEKDRIKRKSPSLPTRRRVKEKESRAESVSFALIPVRWLARAPYSSNITRSCVYALGIGKKKRTIVGAIRSLILSRISRSERLFGSLVRDLLLRSSSFIENGSRLEVEARRIISNAERNMRNSIGHGHRYQSLLSPFQFPLFAMPR